MQDTKIEWIPFDLTGHRVIDTSGYIRIKVPNHPHASSSGYVLEHRVIMENQQKRLLTKKESVHHKNFNKSDNQIDNLCIIINNEHAKTHTNLLDKSVLIKRADALIKYQKTHKLSRNIIFCKCGCGETLEERDIKERSRTFIKGHNTKGKTWKWRKTTK